MSEEQDNISPSAEQMILHLVRNSIWSAASIEEQPSVVIYDWTIKKTDKGEYFVGTEAGGRNGRVSTQIVEFDEAKMVGKTKSGRIYQLKGPSGYSSDGEYVWSYYKERNQLTEVTE